MKTTVKSPFALMAFMLMSAIASVQTAQAVPVPIIQWSYDLYTAFAGSPNNEFTSGNGVQIQQAGQVSWGGDDSVFTPGGNRSGITIASTAGADQSSGPSHVIGTYYTNDTASPGTGAWITHHNNPISSSYATLLSSLINSTLTLTAIDPALGELVSDTIEFKVLFKETPNATPCTVTTSPTACNDIFALNGDNFNKHLEILGYDYYVSIFPTAGPGIVSGSLPFLGASVCADAGASANCVGFTTQESQDTSIQFGFTITSTPINIPEPGTLAIVALGLFGVVLASRKRS